jgi:hypothetical protein
LQVSDGFGSPCPSHPLFPVLRQVPSQEAAGATPGTRTRKIGGEGASSVFSLFNLKSKSKFWTESVIRTGPVPLIPSTSCRLWDFPFARCILKLVLGGTLTGRVDFLLQNSMTWKALHRGTPARRGFSTSPELVGSCVFLQICFPLGVIQCRVVDHISNRPNFNFE